MGELIGRPNFNWNSRDFRTRKSSFLKNKKPFGDYFVEKDEETSISRHDSNSLFFFQGCLKGKGWNHKRRESAFRYFCKNYQNKSVYVFKILSQTQQHNFSLSLCCLGTAWCAREISTQSIFPHVDHGEMMWVAFPVVLSAKKEARE